MRIGHGYDIHKLDSDRKLVLGGVNIPHIKGLMGHSDADVLIHAIMDALIGAAGQGDIGKHFPDTSPEFLNISSIELLRRTNELLKNLGFRVSNVDSTIVAQAPKLSIYIPDMVTNIASVLGVERNLINVKATTTEGLGFAGRSEGIAAYAVAMIERIK